MPNPLAFQHACITLLMSNAAVVYGGLTLAPADGVYEIRQPSGPFEYQVLVVLPKSLDNAAEIVHQFCELTGV
jgi:hypothetical protein